MFYVTLESLIQMKTSPLLVKGFKSQAYARYTGPLSREESLSCHTYCDPSSRFFRFASNDHHIFPTFTTPKGCWGPILTRIPTDPHSICIGTWILFWHSINGKESACIGILYMFVLLLMILRQLLLFRCCLITMLLVLHSLNCFAVMRRCGLVLVSTMGVAGIAENRPSTTLH
jgi:hypothetical protein